MTSVRQWSRTLATALITAAVLLGVGSLLIGPRSGGGLRTSGPTTPTAPPTPSQVQPQQAQPKPTPEGVPVGNAPALGPADSPARGASRGGVPCGSTEQLTYHVHAHLSLFVNGKARAVPLGVGIGKPFQVTDNGGGRFASGGDCFSFLHTHAADGVIHIESPGPVAFTLRQFFAVWNQRLDTRHLGRYRGRVVAYLNGHRYAGDPRAIPLTRHAQIQLDLGRPVPRPQALSWPPNL